MRKRLRIAALVGLGLLLVIVVVLGGLYWAVQQEPDFYRQAVAVDPAAQKEASDQMLRRATALRSDVEKLGPWEALFTAEQINGWLAVDLVQNHPDVLPESFHDPRTDIQPDGITVACRVERGGIEGVVTLTVEPYMAAPNVLGLRIRGVHAGLVPLPLAQVLDAISKAADQMNLRLEWQQADGDPVALIRIPPPADQGGKLIEIQTLKLGEGEIYLSGTTRRQPAGP